MESDSRRLRLGLVNMKEKDEDSSSYNSNVFKSFQELFDAIEVMLLPLRTRPNPDPYQFIITGPC
jgi:hypothetical protein